MTSSFVCATLNLGRKKSTRTEPCGKTFLLIPNILPCDLDVGPTFKKNLTLALTFDLKETGLSHYTWIFLVWQDFSVRIRIYDPVTLTSNFDLLLKNLNLGMNFWDERGKAFLGERSFTPYWNFWSCDLDLQFWPLNLTFALTFELILKDNKSWSWWYQSS